MILYYLIGFASTKGGMSVEVLEMAIKATEEGFEALVVEAWPRKPQVAAAGSCCLVGVLCGRILYIANVGDSRAVLGCMVRSNGVVAPVQLTTEHNVSIEAIRQEVKASHPNDDRILLQKRGVWRVKGIIQVTIFN
jgi:pyruvate dehydrogenase phosphatase